MLSLSKKLFNDTNYLSDEYKIAFNPTKNKLTFYKTDKHLTDLEQITKHVNELQKPTFSEITPYRNCHKKLKAINQSIDPEKGAINLESFNENFKPTSAELKEQVWAVHASRILPNDTLIPFIANEDPSLNELRGSDPGISNTIHFSLGELVRSHSGNSWEDHSFAIITPLSTIIDQTVNLFTHDTFIIGKWNLKQESVVLVPEGTDISRLQDKQFKVVSYSPEKKLRFAINELIQEKKGLAFRMIEDAVLVGSKAFLDDSINVNTPSFFENLLKENKLSFGDHNHSQIGDAEQLGIIKQCSFDLLHPIKRLVYKNLAYASYHTLKYAHSFFKNTYLSKDEQIELEKLLLKIPDRNPSEPLWSYVSPDSFHSMNRKEMMEFKKSQPDLFSDFNGGLEHEFEAGWAVFRWLTIGYELGIKENLDKIIDEQLKQCIATDPKLLQGLIITGLILHNKKHSDRLGIVRAVLNLDGFKLYKDKYISILKLMTGDGFDENQIQQAFPLLTNAT